MPAVKQGDQAAERATYRNSPRCPSSTGGQEDEIKVVGVRQRGLTLPARVKERQYDRDDQGRDAVPLLAGEGRMIIRKLLEGAHEVKKITVPEAAGEGACHRPSGVEDSGRPLRQTRAPASTGGHR